MMIEIEGIAENVRAWCTDVIQAITCDVLMNKVVVETADPADSTGECACFCSADRPAHGPPRG